MFWKKPFFLFYSCVARKVLSQLMCNVYFSFSSWLIIPNYHFEELKIIDKDVYIPIGIMLTDELNCVQLVNRHNSYILS